MAASKTAKRQARTPRPVAAQMTVDKASCVVFSTMGITCPLCHSDVPPNVRHECEKDGGITVRRNTP
jgi:hypothetical protein